MTAPMLATKLYIPLPQPGSVVRQRLVERLNAGRHSKLTLVSAPAGYGKTTLVSDWIATSESPAAWLSLDNADSDVIRFLTCLVAAIQTVAPGVGAGMASTLRSPQPPSAEAILTTLLNEIATLEDEFVLVLDDYHVVESTQVDDALGFLVDNMPPRVRLVITTREDPRLPLARLRVRGQLTELRASDMRFTAEESAEFLNRMKGLNLTDEDIAALETRTEGWIAGLHLAAISMQGHADAGSFIKSFTGSHRFILDYLIEEVLRQQPESTQEFLVRTSILQRMSGPLCDAVLQNVSGSGQQTLEYLEHANLFVVALDNDRGWYRYHHLFAELLRQRFNQGTGPAPGQDADDVAALHIRASEWFEAQGLEPEAFQHAIAANDIERAECLIDGNGSPLYVRGQTVPVLNWLESLQVSTLNARPWMWITFATVLSIVGKVSHVEPNLQAAESAMDNVQSIDMKQHLVNRIEELRELLGILTADPIQMDATIARTNRVDPGTLAVSPAALWKLGLAYFYSGERRPAVKAFVNAISVSEATGNVHVNILASTSLARAIELDNELTRAAETFRRVLRLVGDPPGPVACEAYAGLARIFYERNDLEAARQHGEKSLELARQVEIASFVTSELVLVHLQLAEGDTSAAIASLARTAETVGDKRFRYRMPDVVAMQVLAFLKQGRLEDAAQLARQHELPMAQARVSLAQGDALSALATLEPLRLQLEDKGWQKERLEVMLLQALSHYANDDQDAAIRVLSDVLEIAEPEGFVRTFVDEGVPMAQLLSLAAARGIRPDYVSRLRAALGVEEHEAETKSAPLPVKPVQSLAEPLSQRELEILQLIANGLSNRQISERLFLALATVKGHNRNIFGKLQVERRTEAVARARELGLL